VSTELEKSAGTVFDVGRQLAQAIRLQRLVEVLNQVVVLAALVLEQRRSHLFRQGRR
jgi:hypothetical protein